MKVPVAEQGNYAADTVAKVNALALRGVAAANPVRFGVAHSTTELAAVFRLRYDVAIEQGWARPGDFPSGLERDAYDEQAIELVGWDASILAATARVVLPVRGRRLPTEEAFGVTVEPGDHTVNVGRLCVIRAYRARPPRVFWGLLCQSWVEMRARGFTHACCVLTASVARAYQGWGLRVVPLSPLREYWGQRRFPALVFPAAAICDAPDHTSERHSACCSWASS